MQKNMRKKNLVDALFEMVNKMSRRKCSKETNTESFASEFSQNINRGALSCFAELCAELASNNRIM